MPDIIKGYKIKIPKVTGNVSIVCRATSQQSGSNVYTVTNNLANCTNSNTATSVNEGSPYSATVTPNSGYELMNIAISMGGTNVTSTVYTYQNGNAVINIPNVTGNVVITIQATASSSGGTTTYTVTKNLPNCTSSNTASSVNKNANYSTLISANNGYKIDSITVTMGNTDITSSVVSDE